MATLTETTQCVAAADDDSPSVTYADSLWQSAPRSNVQGFAALMSAVQQLVPPTPGIQKTNRQGPQQRRPQCTHITMHRLYGPNHCHMCGKIPRLGWVYACGQDALVQSQQINTDCDALPMIPDSVDYFEAQAKVAESIGMSASVTKQMRAGEYSFDQIETLLAQKRHLLKAIQQAEAALAAPSRPSSLVKPSVPSENVIASVGASPPVRTSTLNPRVPAENPVTSVGVTHSPAIQQKIDALNPSTRVLPMTPAGTPANTPSDSTANSPAKYHAKSLKKQACFFQVCYTCRPFFHDRLPMSFDSVLCGEVPAVTEDEITRLPFLDPAVVRHLGSRSQPRPILPLLRTQQSLDITQQGDGYNDDATDDWTPTSQESSDSFSSMLGDEDPHPCPGAGTCHLYGRFQGCAYDNGFNDGNRAANHGYGQTDARVDCSPNSVLRASESFNDTPSGASSTGSSVSLPGRSIAPLTPVTPSDSTLGRPMNGSPGRAATVCGVTTVDRQRRFHFARIHRDSNSSLDSEVVVGGGIALTEEAIKNGVPDVMTAR